MKKSIAVLIIGRSGSGKGTQSDLIKKRMGFDIYISTGDIFRRIARKKTIVGEKVSTMLSQGGLAPDWLASFLWQRELVENLDKEGKKIIFDGVARRISEAKSLDDVLSWLGVKLVPIHIEITREEAFKRLKDRGREDDVDESINRRLDWYENDVVEVVDYYENSGRLVKIDGMRNVEDVFSDIKRNISE